MFATAARFLLSALVLLLAVTVSPFIFQEPEPASAPVWSLRVLQTPDEVEVGERVTVEIVLLRNGLPGQIADAHPVLTVLDEKGVAQDEGSPLLVVSDPVRGEKTARSQRWLAEYTAVRPGAAQIHASVVGVVEGASADNSASIHAEGYSETIALHTPQMTSGSGKWMTSLYFGAIVTLCLLSYHFYRQQATSARA